MDKYRSYVGMDVHARSITLASLDTETGEVSRGRLTGSPGAAEVSAWARERCGGEILLAYESGPTGFGLARELSASDGMECVVVAVSTMARSQRERRMKCDPLDAAAVLREISCPAPTCSFAWIPSVEAERARDLVRAQMAAARDLGAARQRVSSLLLKLGFRWDERSASGRLRRCWTRDHAAWMDSLPLARPDRALLDRLRAAADQRARDAADLRADALAMASGPRWKPYVDSIAMLKGVDYLAALLAAAEFDDFSRFTSGRRVSSWLGCVPSNRSSGETEAHGRVTKGGPTALRRLLVEGLASIPCWRGPGKAPRSGQEPLPAAARVARAGSARMLARYEALVAAGKPANKAKVAVVREEIRWIWRIGLEVQLALAGE